LKANNVAADYVFEVKQSEYEKVPGNEGKTIASGVAVITVETSTGENKISIVAGANNEISEKEIELAFSDDAKVGSAKICVCQLEMMPVSNNLLALKLARAKGMTTVLNTAPAPQEGLKSIEMLLPFVDILCPNEVELKMLVSGVEDASLAPAADWDSGDSEKKIAAAKKACAWLMGNTKLGSSEAGARGEMVVTLGGDGALYVQKNGTATHVPLPVKVERKDVVDTSGAGDCFLGAFSAKFVSFPNPTVDSVDIPECIRFGCRAASLSVTRKGTQSSYPSRGELL